MRPWTRTPTVDGPDVGVVGTVVGRGTPVFCLTNRPSRPHDLFDLQNDLGPPGASNPESSWTPTQVLHRWWGPLASQP